MKKIFKWMNYVISTLLLLLLAVVGSLVISTSLAGGEPQIFGYQIKTVLSGSMEPEIQTGSVIAVRMLEAEEKENLKVNDVITFMETEDRLVTHRIIEVNESSDGAFYITKGDNNNGPDRNPVLADNVLASYEGFTIPYGGYFASFAQSPNGILAFLIIPGILMVGYSMITIILAIRKIEVKEDGNSIDTK